MTRKFKDPRTQTLYEKFAEEFERRLLEDGEVFIGPKGIIAPEDIVSCCRCGRITARPAWLSGHSPEGFVKHDPCCKHGAYYECSTCDGDRCREDRGCPVCKTNEEYT